MKVLLAALSTVTFRVPEWGNATIIEAAWTLCGLIGMIVTMYALAHIYRDRQAFNVSFEIDDPTKHAAAKLVWRSHGRREVLRLAQTAMIFAVGVWAMTQDSVVRPSVVTVTTLIITGIFFAIGGITVVQSVQDGRVRREITDLLWTR